VNLSPLHTLGRTARAPFTGGTPAALSFSVFYLLPIEVNLLLPQRLPSLATHTHTPKTSNVRSKVVASKLQRRSSIGKLRSLGPAHLHLEERLEIFHLQAQSK
jgi:hypothetical protein